MRYEKKKKIDLNSPKAKKVIDKIIRETFVKEGTMIAFPLCFPGVTIPIPDDESFITALDINYQGHIYGGTSGAGTHLFVGIFQGATGCVFDMGKIEGANQCVAICCGEKKFIACVNGKLGGRVVIRNFQPSPGDLLQEWLIKLEPFEEVASPIIGEKIIHAVIHPSKRYVFGSTERHLFKVDIENKKIDIIGEIISSRELAIGSMGNIFGLDENNTLWKYDFKKREIISRAVRLPKGLWNKLSLLWAKDPVDNKLYTVDNNGILFSFTEENGFSLPLGKIKLTPVTTMAVTIDGRVFCTSGEGISYIFCYNPITGKITEIGAAVSVIERRRYGYSFGDAITGQDGQIYFGENDNLGHLWIYFPKIQNIRTMNSKGL